MQHAVHHATHTGSILPFRAAVQVSAAWLLLLGRSTGQLRPGLYESVEASYAARGISFSQFMSDVEDEAEEQARGPSQEGRARIPALPKARVTPNSNPHLHSHPYPHPAPHTPTPTPNPSP